MVGPGIFRETMKNVENEKHILQDLEYGDNSEKREKYTVQDLDYSEKSEKRRK